MFGMANLCASTTRAITKIMYGRIEELEIAGVYPNKEEGHFQILVRCMKDHRMVLYSVHPDGSIFVN